MAEREVIAEILEAYRNLACLWDMGSEEYKDITQKNMAWAVLLEKLKKIEPDANIASCKKRIGNLKTAYKREARKVKESKKRLGPLSSEVHRPNLWYYGLMTFLDRKDDLEGSGIDATMSDDEIKSTELNTRRKRPNARVLEEKRRKLETTPKIPNHKPKQISSFSLYIAEQLEQVSTYQRMVAEKLISEIIFLAKTENLNYDSKIETPSKSYTTHFPSSSSVLSFQSLPSPQFIKSSPSYEATRSSPPSCGRVNPSYHSPHSLKSSYIDVKMSPKSESFSPQTLHAPSPELDPISPQNPSPNLPRVQSPSYLSPNIQAFERALLSPEPHSSPQADKISNDTQSDSIQSPTSSPSNQSLQTSEAPASTLLKQLLLDGKQ